MSDNSISNATNRRFEDSEEIVITKQTVKFGNSVYQFKNITGFRVGEIPKDSFPIIPFLFFTGLAIAGYIILNDLIGLAPLVISFLIYAVYAGKAQLYGLIIYLNSGDQRIFKSKDKKFLMDEIVTALYKFMEYPDDTALVINMNDRSINIDGNVRGTINTGDKSNINN